MRYDIIDVPPCVEVRRNHPLWGYVCPLLLEEYDWFQELKTSSPFGSLMQRYWPECIDIFFSWLDNHPEYSDQEDTRCIHGVNSARRAFETFCNPDSPSGMALKITLEFQAARDHHEPIRLGELVCDQEIGTAPSCIPPGGKG